MLNLQEEFLKMNLNYRTSRIRVLMSTLLSALLFGSRRVYSRMLGMFNLNDGRWGRGQDSSPQNTDHNSDPNSGNGAHPNQPSGSHGADGQDSPPSDPPRPRPTTAGPPDLDELWKDFNKKIGRIFGQKDANQNANLESPGGDPNGGGNGAGGGGYGLFPNLQSAKAGASALVVILLLIWLGTGFFIVQEGQQAVITQFGGYHSTVGAGINWRLPYPVQRHEIVYVTQIRSIDIGRDTVMKATGLRESAMLTEDENIVEIKFAVQYRLTDARAYLFESKNPTDAVSQAAETAVREVVGKMRMDSALSEERDQIAPRVRAIMQNILDSYKVGIEVVAINLQQGGVRPPEQVQAAFDDVLKAGQERERAKNEAEAYANDVIPRAVGSASRLKQEADAYKARIVAQAEGDAQRFKSLLAEYQKAPQVTRDRLYIDTMQQIYTNVTKVMVDSHQGSNLLYLPLDKILQMTGQSGNSGGNNNSTNTQSGTSPSNSNASGSSENADNSGSPPSAADIRGRESRGRERDVR